MILNCPTKNLVKNLKIFYVKESSNLISRDNFGYKAQELGQLLEMTELICSFYGYLPTTEKSASELNSVLTYCRLHIGNYFWLGQLCLTILIWMDWIIQMYLYTSKQMQKIKFIPKFISEIISNSLFSIILGMPEHAHLKWLN